MTTSETYLRAAVLAMCERYRIGTDHRLPTTASARHEASRLTKSGGGSTAHAGRRIDRMEGLYVDGHRVRYGGSLVLQRYGPNLLDPPIALPAGSRAEVWLDGRCRASFVEHEGRAIDPVMLLRVAATNEGRRS